MGKLPKEIVYIEVAHGRMKPEREVKKDKILKEKQRDNLNSIWRICLAASLPVGLIALELIRKYMN